MARSTPVSVTISPKHKQRGSPPSPSSRHRSPPSVSLSATTDDGQLSLHTLMRALDSAGGGTSFHGTHPWYDAAKDNSPTPGSSSAGLDALPRSWDRVLSSPSSTKRMDAVLSLHTLGLIDERAAGTEGTEGTTRKPDSSPTTRSSSVFNDSAKAARDAGAASVRHLRGSSEMAVGLDHDVPAASGYSADAAVPPRSPLVTDSMRNVRSLSLCGVAISDQGLRVIAGHANALVDLDLSFVGLPSSSGSASGSVASGTGGGGGGRVPFNKHTVGSTASASASAAVAAASIGKGGGAGFGGGGGGGTGALTATSVGLDAVLRSCRRLARLSLAGAAPALFFGPAWNESDPSVPVGSSGAVPARAAALRVLDLSARDDLTPHQLARIGTRAPALKALRLECVLSAPHVAAFCYGFASGGERAFGGPAAAGAGAASGGCYGGGQAAMLGGPAGSILAPDVEPTITLLRKLLSTTDERPLVCLELVGARGSGIGDEALKMLAETFGASLESLDLVHACCTVCFDTRLPACPPACPPAQRATPRVLKKKGIRAAALLFSGGTTDPRDPRRVPPPPSLPPAGRRRPRHAALLGHWLPLLRAQQVRRVMTVYRIRIARLRTLAPSVVGSNGRTLASSACCARDSGRGTALRELAS